MIWKKDLNSFSIIISNKFHYTGFRIAVTSAATAAAASRTRRNQGFDSAELAMWPAILGGRVRVQRELPVSESVMVLHSCHRLVSCTTPAARRSSFGVKLSRVLA